MFRMFLECFFEVVELFEYYLGEDLKQKKNKKH